MSFAFHSSGERDDTGEYIKPDKWDKNFGNLFSKWQSDAKQKEESQKKIIALPKEFSHEYYNEKIELYHPTSIECYEWKKLKLYALNVYKLLEQNSIIAKDLFKLDESVFEDFINFNAKPVSLEIVVENLKTAETALINQFGVYNNRKLSTKFKKHSALERVRNYGAKAWLMLYALQGNIPLKSMRKFTKAYQNYNLENDEDVLKTYRAYIILKRSFNLYVNPKILSSIYEGIDLTKIFNELCSQVGAFSFDDLIDIRKNIDEDLKRLTEGEVYPDLINFYYLYDNIHKTFYDIKYIARKYYEGYPIKHFNMFDDENGNDLILKGKNYLNLIEKLLKQNLSDVFVNDLTNLYSLGKSALDYAMNAYNTSNDILK